MNAPMSPIGTQKPLRPSATISGTPLDTGHYRHAAAAHCFEQGVGHAFKFGCHHVDILVIEQRQHALMGKDPRKPDHSPLDEIPERGAEASLVGASTGDSQLDCHSAGHQSGPESQVDPECASDAG